MSHVSMRELKAITKAVVIQLVENAKKVGTPEFQEEFTYSYADQTGVAKFEHNKDSEIITFDIYGIKTGFQLPIGGPRETATEYVTTTYSNSDWIGEEYLRINKPQIKSKYERIKAQNKLN